MKKNKGMAYAVLGIIFALFNVIALVVPTDKTVTFWIAYAFTIVAIVSQIVIWKLAFKGTDTIKSKFLGISLISVGLTYLIIQIIAFVIFMAFPFLASWIAIVVSSLILGISAICLIGTEIGKEEIKRVEENVKMKVFYIKELQVDVEILASAENDSETKVALNKLAEKIRFSDPMSNEVLVELEEEIANKVKELKKSENKNILINEIDLLVTERNKKIKLLK